MSNLHVDIESVEKSIRPSWAAEGEWMLAGEFGEDGITFQRDMRHGRAYVYQHFTRDGAEWKALAEPDVNVREDEGLTVADAAELAADLAEAVRALSGPSTLDELSARLGRAPVANSLVAADALGITLGELIALISGDARLDAKGVNA